MLLTRFVFVLPFLQYATSQFEKIDPPIDYFNPNTFDLNDELTSNFLLKAYSKLDYFCPGCASMSSTSRLFRYRFSSSSLLDITRTSRVYYFDERCVHVVRDSLIGNHDCIVSQLCPRFHPIRLENNWYGDVRICIPYHDVGTSDSHDVNEILVGRPDLRAFSYDFPTPRGSINIFNTFTSIPPNNLNRTFYEYCSGNECHLTTIFCHSHRTGDDALPSDFSFKVDGDYAVFTHYPDTAEKCTSSPLYQRGDSLIRDQMLPLNYRMWPFRSREREFASPIRFKYYSKPNESFHSYRLDYQTVSSCSFSEWRHYPHLCTTESSPISKVTQRIHIPSVSSTYSMRNVVDDILHGIESIFSSYFDQILSLYEKFFDRALSFVEPLLEKIFAFFLRIFETFLSFILGFIPYSDQFYTSLFISVILRFKYDNSQTLLIFIFVYLLFVFIT